LLKVVIMIMLPHALAYLGDVGEARAAAEAAIDSGGDVGELYVGSGYVALFAAALAAGDVALAASAAEAGWSRLSRYGEIAAIDTVYMAEAALARSDLTAARGFADDAVRSMTGWWLAKALTTRARVLIAQEVPQAESDAVDALACSAGVKAFLGVPDTLEVLAGLWGDTGRQREAARLFGAAEAIRHRTGECRFQIYQTGYESSVAALVNTMGQEDFDAAWAEGAALSTDEAIAYAQRRHGERKRPTTGWASLTPTELDVVRLVSEGLANNDIATRLFVSPRTVQSHLTHVYSKLGLSSRVQLAQEAARHAD
jgi:DNA-binding CsgD family transcriptional regulator